MRGYRRIVMAVSLGVVSLMAAGSRGAGQTPGPAKRPWLVAHRGASAYAPENTVPAFRLAADQGADFVEFDLQLTKDRQIVCLHDNSLERTTDVEEVFPDRARTIGGAQASRRWMLEDFTLAEIKGLDAGSWLDDRHQPGKDDRRRPSARIKAAGFVVTPYTFRASAVAAGHADVAAEMAHYLTRVGVDGVITDNPDLMPSTKR